jgi:glycosyltransferase involved in cell wall biosynthesis
MRIAAHGVIAENAGSGAGSFAILLRTLLDAGDEVHFYGVPAFTRPKSLETHPRFRFVPLRIQPIRQLYRGIRALGSEYLLAGMAQVSLLAYQRDAVRRMEQAREPYDFVLCLDAVNLWRSTLPVLSWPQSPPQTEWAALRKEPIARAMLENVGRARATAVQAFYAFRWAQTRLALGSSDVMLCASAWSEQEWLRFGLEPHRAARIPYPVPTGPFETLAPPGGERERTTFLWLGRAAPRKRLDLFLEAFERVRARHADARALVVGDLSDPTSQRLLERYRDLPGLTISAPIPRARVSSVFEQSDVLVQPSENENFGFAVAEALGAGRPVVLGPSNGTADYCANAVFAFDRHDPESVAAAMLRARDRVRADGASLARDARAAARRHFDPERVAEQLREIARGAMARRSARGA